MSKDVIAVIKLFAFMVVFGVVVCVPPLIAVEVLQWLK